MYRAGDDSTVDRANITLLKRVVKKSTTPVELEICYHAPLQLGAWSEPQDSVRYTRLRSDEKIPLAEKIAASDGRPVLVFDDSILIAFADVWLLMGYSARESLVVLSAKRIRKSRSESFFQFLLRKSLFHLAAYLYPQGKFNPDIYAIHAGRFCAERGISRQGFQEKLAFAGMTGHLGALKPFVVAGRSFSVRGEGKLRLLNTLSESTRALTEWKRLKIFPWWFSSRHLLFHVAQISAYTGALTTMVSITGGLILLAFALLVTPQFSLTGYGFRRPWLWPAQLVSRLIVYFLG